MGLKTILFTHNDLDGAGCRVIFQLAHMHMNESEYRIVHCSNNNVDQMVEDAITEGVMDIGTAVCFGDIFPSKALLERLVKTWRVRIWDHHKTNLYAKDICHDATIVVETEEGVPESGTSLMYQYYCNLASVFQNNAEGAYFRNNNGNQILLGAFVYHIRSYDTYEWKESDNQTAKRLQTLFSLLGMDHFCNHFVERITGDLSDQNFSRVITPAEETFIDAKLYMEQKRINAFTPDDVYTITVRGLKTAFALHTFANISELSYQFLNRYPEYDMFAAFSFADGGKFEFRTIRDDLNVGTDIALPIGGGGHAKASGAGIHDGARNLILEILLNEMNGNPS